MQINYETFKLKQTIIQAVNSSGLPPVCVRTVLESLYNETMALEKQAIQKEQEECEQEMKKQGDLSNGDTNEEGSKI